MKTKTIKLFSILLTLLLIMGAVTVAPLTARAAGEDKNPVLLYGSCGVDENSDVVYYCFDDGSMAIFGTSAMRNYTLSGNDTPHWYGDNMSIISTTLFINKIAVEYGVTSIGDYSFYIPDNYPYNFFVQLKNVDIATTVTSIGAYAFYNQQIQNIMIPPSVTHIGANAFKKCSLNANGGIQYFGDPAALTWDSDGNPDTEFSSKMTIRILKKYADQVEAFNHQFAYKNIEFVADMEDAYAQEGEAIDRNIVCYYGSTNSQVFGGAAPFIILGRFDGKKKSVTYGSNGFASCVKDGNQYYILTDNGSGALNEAVINSVSGKATGYAENPRSDLKLHLKHEYIGSNIVKVIYTLTNTGNKALTGLQVGGTGDIKIGADDKANIEPLYSDQEGSTDKQIGFYMSSTKDFDKSGEGQNTRYPTLGFIGQNVRIENSGENTATYQDAHFFYGKADANKAESASGTKTLVLIPERIFNKNDGVSYPESKSYDEGTFNQDKTIDSGMSFYWDNITLAAGESTERAVLFSVYGSDSTMLDELKEENFYEVTWYDNDGETVIAKQVVGKGDSPSYPGTTPTRPRDKDNNSYAFSGWQVKSTDSQSRTVEYTATYVVTHHPLFCGHSLTLKGDIGVNFFVDVTPEQVHNGVTIQFEWPGLITQKASCKLSEDDYAGTIGGKELYRARCNVPAAEMRDNIKATAYFGKVEYTKEVDNYSVYAYGKEILKPTTQAMIAYSQTNEKYPKLAALIKTMLNYGAKAQLVFGHNTNSLADQGLTNYDYNPGAVAETDFINAVAAANNNQGATSGLSDGLKTTLDNLGLEFYGSSVVYLSQTSLRIYFKVNDRAAYDTNKGEIGFNESKLASGFVYLEKKDIPAAELDTLQDFTIGSETIRYSVLNSARLLLADGSTDSEINLGKAIYWYNQAANTYFVKNGGAD